ncbi:NADH:flavin oxidoreductase/NADH oxidase [Roseovarius phycicola]|uniref:NADH:flavin oxidoreductase/NADH oxidase n=1 Tax=Roseovarius phycicola TaxID=3080976 RepID=A0ABZ2HET9_9RHOB
MPSLFSPFQLRDVTFKNRIAVSPMSQYRAKEGLANDWHMVHLGRFALGGAALIYAEATAVTKDGRRTHGDLGLWTDEQADSLAPVTRFIEAEGAVPGVQLAHAGRKASERRPWHGETPVDADDNLARGETPWRVIGPSNIPYATGWNIPHEMTEADIENVIDAFGQAARRAQAAGFRVIEVYAAHGFLIHQFLSPIANKRSDRWGGKPENRRRLAIEIARAIRLEWKDNLPLVFRLSATDYLNGGIEIEDTIETAKALKAEGVDMIDCSTGGIGGKTRPKRMVIEQGFQVQYAEAVRSCADIASMAVGFLWDADMCETIIREERADMVALARELLDDPNWPLHAAAALGLDKDRAMWPVEAGWWLTRRDRVLHKFGLR